jgi:hypothetical protein
LATAVEARFEKEMNFRNCIWHVYRQPRRSQ